MLTQWLRGNTGGMKNSFYIHTGNLVKFSVNAYCCLLLCQDQLESVLEVLHRQMEQYKDQPQHAEKISYQQRLLQEDLIHIRAEISKVSTVCGFSCFKETVTKMTVKLYFSLWMGKLSYYEWILLRYRMLNQNNLNKQHLQLSSSMHPSRSALPTPKKCLKISLQFCHSCLGLKLQIFQVALFAVEIQA